MAFVFKRIDKCWQDAKDYTDRDVDFYLEENDWDDYGYQTFYHLHAAYKLTGGSPVYLGALRIMSVNQTVQDAYLLDKLFRNNKFQELPEGFISLSMDVDLYMGLNRYLKTPEEREEIVSALHMILARILFSILPHLNKTNASIILCSEILPHWRTLLWIKVARF